MGLTVAEKTGLNIAINNRDSGYLRIVNDTNDSNLITKTRRNLVNFHIQIVN